ncbi:MAG: sigma-70 family RNA polymerase sigma factor [Planctomycetia bacterium]|nr:sigma-70 family RNA polymerase sigma factor [Planctomycetia bacterium]
MRSIIHRFQSRLSSAEGEPTDERLLEDFLTHRGDKRGVDRGFPQVAEDAFTAIVRRHGPMVRGVCRRVLRNDADADDAFQAVFIVLLRKAEAVRPRNQLGNWLYGVAVNVARRGRDAIARRRCQELTTEPISPASGSDAGELRDVIDQELSRLPVAYRAAIVACDLEGHTRAEAAGRLGWSEGTVASRLARGRAMLAERLSRRGVAIPAAGLLVALGGVVDAAVPVVNFSDLVASPSPAVEALAKEAMQAMMTSKLKAVAVALLTIVGIAGAGAATVWACGGYLLLRPAPPVSPAKPYPFSSVETIEPNADSPPMAWERPRPNSVADAGTDKPADEFAGVAKPARFVLTNPAGDITVVSDRHETFVEFFRRQPVVIAILPDDLRSKLLTGKTPTDFVFLASASVNEDSGRATAYGISMKMAPLSLVPPSRNDPVYRLLDLTSASEPVVFVRDPVDKNLWHAAGFTTRNSSGFFADKKRVGKDDFAPVDLLHNEKPKKK